MRNRVEINVYFKNIVNIKAKAKDVGGIYIPGGGNNPNNNGPNNPTTNVAQLSETGRFYAPTLFRSLDQTTNLPLGTSSVLGAYAPQQVPMSYGDPAFVQVQRFQLDLFPDDTQIPITYQITDISDISTVNSSYTKTIVLPDTKNNREAFGFISDLNVDSTFNPNKRARATVLVDSIVVLDGYIQLNKIIKNKDKQYSRYECVIFADNGNLWSDIGDRLLTDLDLRELDHNRDIQHIVNSWSASVDSQGYYYPLIDYGSSGDNNKPAYGDWTLGDIGGSKVSTGGGIGGSHTASQPFLQPDQLYPGIYVKTLIDKLFQQAGYQYNSNFFNSTYFKNLIIPFGNGTLVRSQAFEIDKKFVVGLGFVYGGYTQVGNPIPNQFGNWSMIMNTGSSFSTSTRPPSIGQCDGIGNIQFSTFPGIVVNSLAYDSVRVRLGDNGNPNTNALIGGSTYSFPIWPGDNDPGRNWNQGAYCYKPTYPYNWGTFSATANDGWQGRMKMRFVVRYKITEHDETRNVAGGGHINFRNLSEVGIGGGLDGLNTSGELVLRRSRDINGNTFSWWSPFELNGLNRINVGTDPIIGNFNPQGAIPISTDIPVIGGLQKPWVLGAFSDSQSTVPSYVMPGGVPGTGKEVTYQGTLYTDWLVNDASSDPNNFSYPIWPGEEVFLEYYNAFGQKIAGLTCATIHGDSTYIFNEFYPDLGPNEPLDMTSTLPTNIKQSDFLMSIIKMFNLYVERDKDIDNPATYRIEPRDNYYNDKVVVKDWTEKVDRNIDFEIDILGNVLPRTTIFTYKADTDYYNSDYKSRWNQVYGQYTYVMDNDFNNDSTSTEVIFSPTPLAPVIGSRGFIIPKISKMSGGLYTKSDSNIRILRKTDSGVYQNPYNEYWGLGISQSHIVPGASYLTFSYYPYVGNFDDPFNPTDDLNFGQTFDLYYGTDIACNTNLFNKYYYTQMEEYNDKDSRAIVVSMYLTPQDIHDFKFSDQIWIDSQYYKVTKIDGFDPTQRQTCQVTLLKSKDITVPRFVAKPVRRHVPHTGVIGGLGSIKNTILSTNAGAIGQGNIIQDLSPGALAIGASNIFGGSNINSLANGNSNVLNAGATSATIHGDFNYIDSNTLATIFGHSNTIAPNTTANVFGTGNIVGTGSTIHIVGDGNFIHDITSLADTQLVTIHGHFNEVGTNSTTTHIIGSNNLVHESLTASVVHIQGSNNIVHTTITASTPIGSLTHIIGDNNLIHPSGTSSLTSVQGSDNILGTGSVVHIVGAGNMIADSVTHSIVLGSNNQVNSSLSNIFGNNNLVNTNSNAKIFGNNISFEADINESIAIGRNINATQSYTVYISDVVFTGSGTGSSVIGLENVLNVNGDPNGAFVTGTFSLQSFDGQYGTAPLVITNISSGVTSSPPPTQIQLIGGHGDIAGIAGTTIIQPTVKTTNTSLTSILLANVPVPGYGTIEGTIGCASIGTYTCKLYASYNSSGFIGRIDKVEKSSFVGTQPTTNLMIDNTGSLYLMLTGVSTSTDWFGEFKLLSMQIAV